jgi:uncharacterized membrane protein YhhN
MEIVIGWVVATALLVAGALWATKSGRHELEWVFKPLAALSFVLLGLYTGALTTRWGTVLFVGLVLAAGGDVLLIPKSRRFFLFGLVSFLLGHVAYAVAFGLRGLDVRWLLGALVLLAAIAVFVLRWLWPHVEREMRIPVAAYMIVITSMVALGAGTFGARGDARLLVGAVAFYLSDLAVARDRFVSRGFVNRLWGLPVYFGAQLLLAMSAGGS